MNGNGGFIAVRTALEPEQMANVLRALVRPLDPKLPLTQVQSMERTVSDSEVPRRFNTVVLSTFALAAVLLVALGMYSVIAFSAALRTQEMVIRMALGSQRAGILRLVFASAAKVAIPGCAIGLLGAAAASRLLGSFPVWRESLRSAGADPGCSFRTAAVLGGFVAAGAACSFHRPHERSSGGMTVRLLGTIPQLLENNSAS